MARFQDHYGSVPDDFRSMDRNEFSNAVLMHAIKSNLTAHMYHSSRLHFVNPEFGLKYFCEQLTKLYGMTRLAESHNRAKTAMDYSTYYYNGSGIVEILNAGCKDPLVNLSSQDDDYFDDEIIESSNDSSSNLELLYNISLRLTNHELMVLVSTLLESLTEEVPYVPPAPQPGTQISALLKGFNGLEVRSLDLINEPLIRGNYSDNVLAAYDKALNDLNSDKPSGKLVIFDGPPGTGKTYLVRALLTEAPRCHYLLVAPDVVSEIGKPEILTTLLDEKVDGIPLVLVLEDADALLSVRKRNSMSGIAAALNLGDGILGDALGIRLIATTNSPISEFDKALLRPGRLSVRCQVGSLGKQRSAMILERLSQGKLSHELLSGQEEHTLAEIYNIAQENTTDKQD